MDEHQSGAEEDNPVTADETTVTGLTKEALVERVLSRMSPRKRERIPRQHIVEAVDHVGLEANEARPVVPRLRLQRLIFSGEKDMASRKIPFRYDQEFAPGVNVLLIERNLAGKSTILKTIKYALTGDGDVYDGDVKDWVRKVWLHFALDATILTVHIDRTQQVTQGFIAVGAEERGVESVAEMPMLLERMSAADEIKDALNRFFLKRFDLHALGWTNTNQIGDSTRRNASWNTFFQAIHIHDKSFGYLICDDAHAIGGQDNIIMSEFLGLAFSEALNDLMIEKQTATKKKKLNADEVSQAQAEGEIVKAEIKNIERELRQIEAGIQARRAAVQEDETITRLATLQSEGADRTAELRHLQDSRVGLNRLIQRKRARAKRLREGVDIKRHFTSFEVRQCPRCTTAVGEDAVERERADHLCRVCGKEATIASATETEVMQEEADALDHEVAIDIRQRDELNAALTRVEAAIADANLKIGLLEGAAKKGMAFGFATPEEEKRMAELREVRGGLKYRLSILASRADDKTSEVDDAQLRAEAHDAVRSTLRLIAEERNADVLSSLGTLTQEMTNAFGAESVSEVTCSSVGHLSMKKHGTPVTFKTVRNAGEQLRLKLAFFIALMRLGRLGGGASVGRHPGLLLIDQPASAEMVPEHVLEVAHALKKLDDAYSDDLQIICFTADSAFRQATVSEKIFGPQAEPYAF